MLYNIPCSSPPFTALGLQKILFLSAKNLGSLSFPVFSVAISGIGL